jgi:hypothetical protein
MRSCRMLRAWHAAAGCLHAAASCRKNSDRREELPAQQRLTLLNLTEAVAAALLCCAQQLHVYTMDCRAPLGC